MIMQAKITPSLLASARYHHRRVIEKVRPASRTNPKATLSVAISALEADFDNAVTFSLFGTPCLATIGSVSLEGLGKIVQMNQSDRQALIARLLVAVNELSAKERIVPVPQSGADGLAQTIEQRARLIIEAGVVAVENNVAAAFGAQWLPNELLATTIANISKAVALIYSLGTPAAYMPELQRLLNGKKKCKALSLLITIGWHLDRLEELLRPIVETPSSESVRIERTIEQTRAARARETTLIVVHPPAGITYWSLWRLANHSFIAPQAVLEVMPTAVAS
jgi:hypothetical protein